MGSEQCIPASRPPPRCTSEAIHPCHALPCTSPRPTRPTSGGSTTQPPPRLRGVCPPPPPCCFTLSHAMPATCHACHASCHALPWRVVWCLVGLCRRPQTLRSTPTTRTLPPTCPCYCRPAASSRRTSGSTKCLGREALGRSTRVGAAGVGGTYRITLDTTCWGNFRFRVQNLLGPGFKTS